ncbi:DUF6302 family protein [Streptomyces sp. NPDC050804]|uniref:DUF6302 family protein n=1 Tax=unclassified Streptomyces TaxID=2593676 RepID=UPI0034430050|nr:DUF6302 family protein [Streptomyces sp. NBC_00872]
MKHTVETDRASMREKLADPALLDLAFAVPVGEADGKMRYRLAVPVGGSRRAGFLTVANDTEAKATLAALAGRQGFPSVRLRGTVTAHGARRTVVWGDDFPRGDAVTRWKHLGYSDEAIVRYEQQALKDL